jgi:hypothetical protein
MVFLDLGNGVAGVNAYQIFKVMYEDKKKKKKGGMPRK